MSIHTLVKSSITSFESLVAVLNEAGMQWKRIDAYRKQSGQPAIYAVEAKIGNETVLIVQYERGAPFMFQSNDWQFRSKQAVVRIAFAGNEGGLQWREVEQQQEQQRERERQIAEQRWQEAEKQRAEEQRKRGEDAKRRVQAPPQPGDAEDHRRIEGQKVPQTAERPPAEDASHQVAIAAEAKRLLAQMDAEASADRQRQGAANTGSSPAPPPGSTDKPEAATNVAEMDRFIGKLHQQNAERKIMEKVEEMKQMYGVSLQSADTLQDQSRLLVLRG